jgi:hypothetical protein
MRNTRPRVSQFVCSRPIQDSNLLPRLSWSTFYTVYKLTSRKLSSYFYDFIHHHHRHHQWQNSPSSAVAFLRRFCQIASGFHNRASFSALRLTPKLEGQVSLFMSPSDRVVQLYTRHWVPFPSSSTSRSATVEVF